jgi:hypothetical protein
MVKSEGFLVYTMDWHSFNPTAAPFYQFLSLHITISYLPGIPPCMFSAWPFCMYFSSPPHRLSIHIYSREMGVKGLLTALLYVDKVEVYILELRRN